METKFKICDEVYFFNATKEAVESDVVRSARIIATGVSQNESGAEVCDGTAVLYDMKGGFVLTENEVFASREECVEHYADVFARMKTE